MNLLATNQSRITGRNEVVGDARDAEIVLHVTVERAELIVPPEGRYGEIRTARVTIYAWSRRYGGCPDSC